MGRTDKREESAVNEKQAKTLTAGENRVAGKVLFRNLQILRREVLTWIDQVWKLPDQNCIASQPSGWCHADINVMALNNVILKPWPNFPLRIPLQLHFPHWHEALNGYYGGHNNQKQTSLSRLAQAGDNRGALITGRSPSQGLRKPTGESTR